MAFSVATTTICIVGFPPDGVYPRELKNLCRFMMGFEGAHVAFAGIGLPTTLFVKFQTTELAMAAIEQIHGTPFDLDAPQQTLKAEFARREMEVRPQSTLPAPLATPGGPALWPTVRPPIMPSPAAATYPAMRAAASASPPGRLGATGGELVTIAVFAIKEKGLTVPELQAWFQERPGFVALQMNERIDGMFIRFETQQYAEQAIHDASAEGVAAEWARRNLDDDRSGGLFPIMPQVLPQPAGGFFNPGVAGKRIGATGGELVTICVLGLAAKDVTAEQLQSFFQQRPGFDRMQINERIGGLFVKFTSYEAAEQALQEANALGFGAEWARRNLDDDLAAKNAAFAMPLMPFPALYPPMAMPLFKGGAPPKRFRAYGGEIDTLTLMGVREKEQAHGNLQQWFAERPGYVALQINEKIDAMFVKFSSRAAAEQAMTEANTIMLGGVEWARRNLDL